jgi:hypothetical protein
VTSFRHAVINEEILGRDRSRPRVGFVLATIEIFVSAVVSPQQNTESERHHANDNRHPIDEAPPE